MKILFISAYYPPDHSGGYELRMQNIIEKLMTRGHTIRVLTTKPEKKINSTDLGNYVQIFRKLSERIKPHFFIHEILNDLIDIKFVESQIDQFDPDVIYLGHVYPLSKMILPFLSYIKTPKIFDEGGVGLSDAWINHGRWFRLTGGFISKHKIINFLKPFFIEFVLNLSQGRIKKEWSWPKKMTIIFNSEQNKNKTLSVHIPIQKSHVIYSGIDLEKFTFVERNQLNSPITILVPGRIEPRKGQMDSIFLVEKLIEFGIDTNVVIVGKKYSSTYLFELEELIQQKNLQNKISFLPMMPQDSLVEFYQKSDFCFFPSYQEVGFSRIPLEAMACGAIVISYGNEGTNELIIADYSGIISQPKDFDFILKKIKELRSNSFLVKNLVFNARRIIEKEHSLENYVNTIEEVIFSVSN